LKRLTEDGRAIVVAGQHILAEDHNSLGEGTPYLTGPADFGPIVAEIKHWTQSPKTLAQYGDILITVKGAGVGKINFAPNTEVAIGRQLMAIRPSEKYLLREFVYFFLLHRFKHFQSIATATTVPGFKKSDLETLEIPELSIHEQHQIVTHLETLQSKLNALKCHQAQTAAELDALLPAVLERAFRGEL
jgi:type I restriction enzyme S subunit